MGAFVCFFKLEAGFPKARGKGLAWSGAGGAVAPDLHLLAPPGPPPEVLLWGSVHAAVSCAP